MKRPLAIWLAVLVLLSIAIANLVVAAIFNLVPLWGDGGVVSRLSVSDTVVELLYLFAAIAVFSVRKTGWWLYITIVALLFIYNIYVFAQNPLLSALYAPLFQLSLLAAVAWFFRREVIAPYFHPRLRWWEQAERFEMVSRAAILSDRDNHGTPVDISESGCFILFDAPLQLGKNYLINLQINRIKINISARVMRYTADSSGRFGYGFRFIIHNSCQLSGIKALVKGLEALVKDDNGMEKTNRRVKERYNLTAPVVIESAFGETRSVGRLINLSKSGCLLQLNRELTLDSSYVLFINIKNSVKLTAVMVWSQSDDKGWLLGGHFRHNVLARRPDNFMRLYRFFKKQAVRRKNINRIDYKRISGQLALTTPYGYMINFLKR